MSEFLLELYSEEIPPHLQINARNQLKQFMEKSLKNEGVNYKACLEYSSPTRLSIYIKGLPDNIKIKPNEIRGPKVGVENNILEGFMKSRNVSAKDLFKKFNWPIIDVTRRSVEETAASILKIIEIKKNK